MKKFSELLSELFKTKSPGRLGISLPYYILGGEGPAGRVYLNNKKIEVDTTKILQIIVRTPSYKSALGFNGATPFMFQLLSGRRGFFRLTRRRRGGRV